MNLRKDKNAKLNRYIVIMLVATIVVAVILMGIYLEHTSKAVKVLNDNYREDYENIYAFISIDRNDDFFEAVYEAAKESGEENNDYVEYWGKDLATEYSREELLDIAIAAKVDGIFLEADESAEIIALINKAVNAGIPVITMGSDCSASLRQSFVGVNNFSLGQDYGKQILKLGDRDIKTVMVLMNPNTADTSQNIVYAAIKEQLESNKRDDIDLQAVAIDNATTFSVEESIRDIITRKNTTPDVLVCLNESNTGSAYQAIVDYNRVGNIDILGYHKNASILDGILQKNIYASFEVDTNQMGRYLINAMDEYKEYGYVNEYMTVDVNLINSDNVEEYINEME